MSRKNGVSEPVKRFFFFIFILYKVFKNCMLSQVEHEKPWNLVHFQDSLSNYYYGCPNFQFFTLTHCIQPDTSTVICWTRPLVILWVGGVFCRFYSIFDRQSCSQTL